MHVHGIDRDNADDAQYPGDERWPHLQPVAERAQKCQDDPVRTKYTRVCTTVLVVEPACLGPDFRITAIVFDQTRVRLYPVAPSEVGLRQIQWDLVCIRWLIGTDQFVRCLRN